MNHQQIDIMVSFKLGAINGLTFRCIHALERGAIIEAGELAREIFAHAEAIANCFVVKELKKLPPPPP